MTTIRELCDRSWDDIASGPLEPVEVAVVDSGVDSSHPALASRVASAWAVEMPNGNPTMSGQTVPADNDLFGHGTSVAGIVAAVAPNARIVDIRVLDSNDMGSGDAVLAGLRWAVENNIRIVNVSIACKARFAPHLVDLCELAYRRNVLIVAAKRNMPLLDNGYPAELSAAVSVDAGRFPRPYDVEYRSGHPIEFIGQGVDVPTCFRGGHSGRVTGTSFATPTISGLCALLAGAAPALRTFELKSLLKYHAKPHRSSSPSINPLATCQ